MYISKSRFINWTRCPMYFPMDLEFNTTGKADINAEHERREERLGELKVGVTSFTGLDYDAEEESYDAGTNMELEALLPYYNQVENKALEVAKKYFHGTFLSDSKEVRNQKLFEYKRNGHTYRCYVDIYNENDDEINIIEVKATTNSKYIVKPDKDGKLAGLMFSDLPPRKRGGNKYPLFVKNGNIWRLNFEKSRVTEDANTNFCQKKKILLDRYRDEGKYPHDIAFQRFVIERALGQVGDKRRVNYYLALLNSEYVYDGSVDAEGKPVYNEANGHEIVTFFDMNEITSDYQPFILKEIATLESYITKLHDISTKVPVGKWCEWNKNTECVFFKHCFEKLRKVPNTNSANKYLYSGGAFKDFTTDMYHTQDKYDLINKGYWKFDDVPEEWLTKENHHIQRDCYDNVTKEHVDKEKMQYWFNQIEYPIYHLDFEGFPCPLPRFKGESPYTQSVFEFSLHIERAPGVCDKEKDNFIFLNKEYFDDEREKLAKAIVDHFEFNEDGSLKGTMLAQFTAYEKGRLEELAEIYPEYSAKLLAIRDKAADLLDLLRTNKEMYKYEFPERAEIINYYHKDLSGSYSIKKTLPVLMPSLTYKGMDVGNGVQAYIAYINYDSPNPTNFEGNVMKTKEERREALKRYCQQDTWAMVEILRAVREKIKRATF